MIIIRAYTHKHKAHHTVGFPHPQSNQIISVLHSGIEGEDSMKLKTGSMLAQKCQECERRNACAVKRMEMYWYNVPDDCPQLFGYAQPAMAELTQPLIAPIVETYTPITINMGEYGTIHTSHEELKRQLQREIEKELYKRCFHFGA